MATGAILTDRRQTARACRAHRSEERSMASSKIEPSFEEYRHKYRHVRMQRRDGILEICVHTGGGSLKWGALPHEELSYCFADIGADRENKVIIITGAGDSFCAETDIASFGEFTPEV